MGGPNGKTYRLDAITQLSQVVDPGSVQACVTSTAYWGKRSYFADYDQEPDKREMGKGSLDEFIGEQILLGRAIYEALDDEGTYWLNVADTNSGSGGAGGDHGTKGSKGAHTGHGGIALYRQGDSGIPRGQQCLVPERIALALQQDGWLVRKVVTWDKGKPVQETDIDGEPLRFAIGGIKPEDPRHVRRPRYASETILMLTKGMRYRYNIDAEEEPGDVWHFPAYRGKRIGPAPFPLDLPRRCIALSSEPGGLVLDPCMGTGQTARAAEALGREWIGTDLYLGDPIE